MEFCMTESCGKCIPCRAGTVPDVRPAGRITDGQATAADLALLEELCDMVKHTSLCGLGQSAPNPVLSTLRYFRHEYRRRTSMTAPAPAGVCQSTRHRLVAAIKKGSQ